MGQMTKQLRMAGILPRPHCESPRKWEDKRRVGVLPLGQRGVSLAIVGLADPFSTEGGDLEEACEDAPTLMQGGKAGLRDEWSAQGSSWPWRRQRGASPSPAQLPHWQGGQHWHSGRAFIKWALCLRLMLGLFLPHCGSTALGAMHTNYLRRGGLTHPCS